MHIMAVKDFFFDRLERISFLILQEYLAPQDLAIWENAPWMFMNAYNVYERAQLADNCFELEPGENVELSVDVYEYEAETELDINPVIRQVYYRYHKSPRKASDLKTTVADLSQAVYKDAWLPDDLAYSCQVFEEENGGYRYNIFFCLTSLQMLWMKAVFP
jgi:hypothetical protein